MLLPNTEVYVHNIDMNAYSDGGLLADTYTMIVQRESSKI